MTCYAPRSLFVIKEYNRQCKRQQPALSTVSICFSPLHICLSSLLFKTNHCSPTQINHNPQSLPSWERYVSSCSPINPTSPLCQTLYTSPSQSPPSVAWKSHCTNALTYYHYPCRRDEELPFLLCCTRTWVSSLLSVRSLFFSKPKVTAKDHSWNWLLAAPEKWRAGLMAGKRWPSKRNIYSASLVIQVTRNAKSNISSSLSKHEQGVSSEPTCIDKNYH